MNYYAILSLLTLGVVLSSCAGSKLTTDSYCSVYQPVIRAEGDGAIQAKPDVKRRIATNEVTHRRLCK
jgi:hypothetical protein